MSEDLMTERFLAEDDFTAFQKTLAIVPKITAFASMIGSSWIIHHVMKSRDRRRLVYHRLVMCMSIADVLSSLAIFLSTWPMPKGSAYWAAGNTQTCIAHGFLSQGAAIATPSYNTMLSVYYYLVVSNAWSERRIAAMEPYFHAWPIFIGLGSSIAGVPLTLFNPSGFLCWIQASPGGCDQNDDVECDRGPLAYVFRWAFFYAWIWFYFVVNGALIAKVYHSVLEQERKTDKYKTPGQKVDRKRSRSVANQALLFMLAYYITFLFGTITRSMQLRGTAIPEPIFICFAVFYPLQGFFNAIIYLVLPWWRKQNRRRGQGRPTRSWSGDAGRSSTFFRRVSRSAGSFWRRPPTNNSQDQSSLHMGRPSTGSMGPSTSMGVSSEFRPRTNGGEEEKQADEDHDEIMLQAVKNRLAKLPSRDMDEPESAPEEY